jgi:hypothetical protein
MSARRSWIFSIESNTMADFAGYFAFKSATQDSSAIEE